MADDADEIRRLLALKDTGLLTTSTSPALEAVCEEAKARFQVQMALVTLIGAELQIVKARAGTDLEETPRSVAFCDHTIRSDAVLVVRDAKADPRFAANPLVTGEPFIRFYAGAPLIYRDRVRLGALCVIDPRPRDFTLGDKAELEAMADEVVGLIIQQEVDGKLAAVGLGRPQR
jgi:GAF domain-containing protein